VTESHTPEGHWLSARQPSRHWPEMQIRPELQRESFSPQPATHEREPASHTCSFGHASFERHPARHCPATHTRPELHRESPLHPATHACVSGLQSCSMAHWPSDEHFGRHFRASHIWPDGQAASLRQPAVQAFPTQIWPSPQLLSASHPATQRLAAVSQWLPAGHPAAQVAGRFVHPVGPHTPLPQPAKQRPQCCGSDARSTHFVPQRVHPLSQAGPPSDSS